MTLFDTMKAKFTDDQLVRLSHLHRPMMQQWLCGARTALEIGCWKGETSFWLLEQGVEKLTVVDTFEGSAEHREPQNLLSEFQQTVGEQLGRIDVRNDRSIIILPRLMAEKRTYEFIYVDGSHDSRDVIIDASLGFELLAAGGRMVFDDYRLSFPGSAFRSPRPAIDFFLNAYADEMEVLHVGFQVAVRKI